MLPHGKRYGKDEQENRFAIDQIKTDILQKSAENIIMISMDSQDESRYRRLSPNDTHDFLNNLAVHYLTREDARSIIQRIRKATKDKTAVRVFPQPKDFTSQMAKSFSFNLASSLSFLNRDTGRGENREWEVGKHSRYEDIDPCQSDTSLSM